MEKQLVKLIKSLSDKKHRSEHKLFVVEGIKLCEEILNSSFIISKLFYTETPNLKFEEIESYKITSSEMARISTLKSTPTILALVKIPESNDLTIDNNELILALDAVQDPGNLGTIIRICDWFGIRKILCSKECADIYNSKVVQSTMGAISRVKVYYCDLEEKLAEAKKLDIPIYSTDLNGENIYKTTLSKNGIIIMGNEGKGVSEKIKDFASHNLLIPSYPENNICESLNVAVATAIVCAEFRR